MSAVSASEPDERSLPARPAGRVAPEVTAQVEREVVAALLALRHRAERSSSAAPGGGGAAPEAGWRRTRLAALGRLPRFPPGPAGTGATHRD